MAVDCPIKNELLGTFHNRGVPACGTEGQQDLVALVNRAPAYLGIRDHLTGHRDRRKEPQYFLRRRDPQGIL